MWRIEKFLTLAGLFDLSFIQPIANCYTDCAVPTISKEVATYNNVDYLESNLQWAVNKTRSEKKICEQKIQIYLSYSSI
jgi:hypothetical protein